MRQHAPAARLREAPPFWRRAENPDGTWSWDSHPHPGQSEALKSEARVVAVIAGGQSGKTLIGPPWLLGEMQRCGEGDYLVAAPDYPTLKKQAVPELQALFESVLKLGKLNLSPLEFKFSQEGLDWMGWSRGRRPPRILFGHTTKPSTMEAMGVKAAWIDEAGMAGFRLAAWEDLQQRLAISQGRILLTSKPYSLNWLKTHVYDRWRAGDPGYHVVQFGSAMNPAYPPEEIERAKGILPRWKFNMHYLGRFERPAGLIYDCFEKRAHTRPWAAVSPRWPRRLGLDFGSLNACGVFLADEVGGDGTPSGRFIAYREHKPGQRLTPEEHVRAILQGEPGLPDAWGGSRSEDGWRERFAAAGLPVREPPNIGVEPGIDAVYALIKEGRLLIMDNCTGLLDDISNYSRVVDGDGEPTEKIADQSGYHYCFVAGTGIGTPAGVVPIEAVRVGQPVLTRRGVSPVSATMTSSGRRLMRVDFTDGRSLVGTPDHPIWTKERGLVPIDSLRYGDTALRQQEVYPCRQGIPVRVARVTEAGRGTVYNLTVAGPHEYFANGVLVSNCDALRYICAAIRLGGSTFDAHIPAARSVIADAPPGVFLGDEYNGRGRNIYEVDDD